MPGVLKITLFLSMVSMVTINVQSNVLQVIDKVCPKLRLLSFAFFFSFVRESVNLGHF